MTLDGYCELLDTLVALDLVDHVAPIQLAIRLLVPSGSRLLAIEAMRPFVGSFDDKTLTYRWSHPDPRVDALQQEVSATVGRRLTSDRRDVLTAIRRAGLRACRPAAASSRWRRGSAARCRTSMSRGIAARSRIRSS